MSIFNKIAEEVSFSQGLTISAILFTGILGASIALLSLVYIRRTARERNSLELLIQMRENDNLKEGLKIIRAIHHSKHDDMEKFCYEDEQNTDEALSIRGLLNFFEVISLGIRRKFYDEIVIKASHFSTFILVWNMTLPYITKRRQMMNNDKLFMEFEGLIVRWQNNPFQRIDNDRWVKKGKFNYFFKF